jgi:tripartite-type tricarboxylate transporter receptor subunit TctC
MLHVPYKGNGPALLEVMAGRVDFMLYPIIGIGDQVSAKRVKILAVGTKTRLPQFADAPTMSEVGFPGFEETAPWVGMLAPAKTPPEAVNKIHEAMVKALAKPEVKAQLEKLGAIVVGDTPTQFGAYLQRDHTQAMCIRVTGKPAVQTRFSRRLAGCCIQAVASARSRKVRTCRPLFCAALALGASM